MPLKEYITAPLRPEQFYHIYNRGNAGTRIFFKGRNYTYFLGKYATYSDGYWDTCAYCLLPDHFHLLIRIKPLHAILDKAEHDMLNVTRSFCHRHQLPAIAARREIRWLRNTGLDERQLASWVVSERIRRLMLGYAKAINNQQQRYGSLFQKLFRRKWISPASAANLVLYIHRNPVHHGYCTHPSEYPWSSFDALLNGDPDEQPRLLILPNLSEKSDFLQAHEAYVTQWHQLSHVGHWE